MQSELHEDYNGFDKIDLSHSNESRVYSDVLTMMDDQNSSSLQMDDSYNMHGFDDEEIPEFDAELAKLSEMTEESRTHVEGTTMSLNTSSQHGTAGDEDDPSGGDQETAEEIDKRSIYVGNVDYYATPQELQEHFKSCGAIKRITILVDKFTYHPKGYAYVEFADPDAVTNALVLSDTVLRGRQIKVDGKRKNIPGFNGGTTRARGRPARRGRVMYRGGYGRGYQPPPVRGFHGYGPRYRGRGLRARGPY